MIDDTAAVTVSHVRAKARRLSRKAGLSLVVIDYLQLMRGDGHNRDNRTQEMGSISRGLKALAKELQVPIIALAQLNRGVEGRADKRPMLSDLRDSGEIEQDADIVVMLHREALYSESPEWAGLAEALVRKNRNGPTGELLLSYQPDQMRFADYCGAHPRRNSQPKASRGGYTRGIDD
jgi:replicative DNA helicase